MEETHVVTVFLRHRGDVLLLRRSDEVGSYAGRWGTVAGHVESEDSAADEERADGPAERDADAAARREIREETGIDPDAVSLVRRGEAFAVADADLGTRWVVHPFLFDCPTRKVTTNRESAEYDWASPTELLGRDTVPELWRSYRAVAPSVESIRSDDEHGSAYLSVRALEVLRDRAAEAADFGEGWAAVAETAAALLDARPAMAAVRNRIDRVMHEAADATPGAAETAAIDAIDRALDADDQAAAEAADLVDGERVVTLSRSGTVRDALRRADPGAVLVGESRPAREGVGVAESLAADGVDVTLTTDAALAALVSEYDAVLFGADAVTPRGAVVNKAGTRALALAAARGDVPVYAACAADKIRSDADVPAASAAEAGYPAAVYDGSADVAVRNPIFDRTPADLVTRVVTERGRLDADGVADVAAELRDAQGWRA
jgi:translation initiation factor 2B subunit (eIF-2B alpha/beta/delta family)